MNSFVQALIEILGSQANQTNQSFPEKEIIETIDMLKEKKRTDTSTRALLEIKSRTVTPSATNKRKTFIGHDDIVETAKQVASIIF